MPTLSEYFETEARDSLAQLQRELQRELPDTALMHRAVRALRGTAQMARESRIHEAAVAVEAVLRAVTADRLAWSDDVAQRARATVDDLYSLLRREGSDAAQDALVQQISERWRNTLEPAEAGPPPRAPTSIREFREFAAREVDEIASALDSGLQQLAAAPMDREPLKVVLRRQRALLGAARLDEIPVVAEILRAVEDLTRVIARLDVGVKQEWLDIYRIARDALRTAVEPLQRAEDPPSSHAVSRLRHIRQELLERYGSVDAAPGVAQPDGFLGPPQDGAAVPAGGGPDGPGAAVAGGHAEAPASGEPDDLPVLELSDELIVEQETGDRDVPGEEGVPVGVELLMYDRDAALRRALELRSVIARATAADPQARDATDELFDLIRLALE